MDVVATGTDLCLRSQVLQIASSSHRPSHDVRRKHGQRFPYRPCRVGRGHHPQFG